MENNGTSIVENARRDIMKKQNRYRKHSIIKMTINNNLCLGCGICAATCPEHAIAMHWGQGQTWVPQIDEAKCTDCGLCSKICPNTPERISEYAMAAAKAGERFGLPETARHFIAYNSNPENRIRSASGGALSAVLMHLLKSGKIDGVIASVPILAQMGEPHYELRIMRSIEELDEARSSHYHPLSYDRVLREVGESSGRYALVGVPCAIRGIKQLPEKLQSKIRYTFCLVCSHNVTGQFLDCLAKQEGVLEGEPYIADLRDKIGGIPDAGNYNNYFKLPDREIRRNRFQTAFTDMWRNYFFAHECCLYCPDFYGADADLSVKDAWGRLSVDPLGISLLIVRNPELVATLKELAEGKILFLESCDADEIFQSQIETPIFKHIEVRDRLVWKSAIRQELLKNNYPLGTSRRWWKMNSLIYWQFRMMLSLSDFFYTRTGRVPVRKIILINRIVPHSASSFVWRKLLMSKRILQGFISPITYITVAFFKYSFTRHPKSNKTNGIRVLIAGGHGYQNTGDEAQLATVISHWKRLCPDVELTILSPNPEYTEKEHGEHSELAPRVTLFNANKKSDYGSSNFWFRWRFQWIKLHMLFIAKLYRKGLPLIGAYPHEVHLLYLIANADVFHLSGGGYLTGMTLSRLWENMLLIRIADLLGTPVILSGQTIGVFKDKTSKMLARWGLKKAKLIYLRDAEGSMADVHSLGIKGPHINSTFDDALFCDIADNKTIDRWLEKNEIATTDKYAVVNVHFWGQKASESHQIMKRIADVCDYVVSKHNLQVVFMPMHPTDIDAMEEVQMNMSEESRIIDYNFDYRVTKGIISRAEICIPMKHHTIIFAMGAGVPTITITLDDYYFRKNQGALKLFGQEQWIVGYDGLFSSDILENKVDDCLTNSQEIKKTILSHSEEMKTRDGETIQRFIKEYGIRK